MNKPCGYWAHCAYHCDLTCDHDEWCPDGPPPPGPRNQRRKLRDCFRASQIPSYGERPSGGFW